MTRIRAFFLGLFVIEIAAAIILVAIALAAPAKARDNGQYAQVSPEIREWVRGLKDRNGVGCCDTADGFPAEEVEWSAERGGYSVVIEGQRHPVPPAALLDGPNKLGRAMVWWIRLTPGGTILIRCFIPGTMG